MFKIFTNPSSGINTVKTAKKRAAKKQNKISARELKYYSFKTRAQVIPEMIEKSENNSIPVTKDCDKVMMGKGVSGEKGEGEGERGREEGGERKRGHLHETLEKSKGINQSEES